MNKKPELFVNKIDRNVNNNDRVYYSGKEVEVPKKVLKKNMNPLQKINSIFSASNYIYKAQVKIKFKDKEEIKVIVGKNKNHLITMDNELISISDIIDIETI